MGKTIWERYGVKRRSTLVEEDSHPNFTSIELGAELREALELAQQTEEKGKTHVHYVSGLPDKSKTRDFGVQARGRRGHPGVYWDIYQQDGLVASSVDSQHEGLVSGTWSFGLPKDTPEELEERLGEQSRFLAANLLGKPSSWKRFLKNFTYADRLYGFGLWNIVDREDGGIAKLAWRDPSTVDKWVFDAPMREWLATRFEYRDGSSVDISAEHLLLYTTGTGETDPEGTPPVRRVVRWVEIKQLVAQIEVAAAEAHGTGYVTAQQALDDSEKGELKDIILNAHATDIPFIDVPPGVNVEWLSPQGKLPDFDTIKRYCDEQSALMLQSTGSLVGLGDTGTYNLAETKDAQENIRRVEYYGQAVCDLINEYIVPRVLENAFDGPVAPGLMPQLQFSIGQEAADPKRFDQIGNMVELGVLTWRRKDENKLREEFSLELLPEEDDEEESKQTDDQLVYKISNAVQNGVIPLTESLARYTLQQLGAPDPGDAEIKGFIRRMQDKIESQSGAGGPDSSSNDPTTGAAPTLMQPTGPLLPLAGCTHDHPAFESDPAAIELSEGGIYLARGFDPDRMNKWLDESNNNIARELQKVARAYRDEYVRLTAGVSDPTTILQVSRTLRNKYRKQMNDAIRGEVYRVAVKGSAVTLRELGALAPEQGELPLPQVPKDPEAAVRKYNLKSFSRRFDKWADLVSDRIAKHAFNITESMLEANAVPELSPNAPEASKPPIPEFDNYANYANNYTSRSFQSGREAIVEAVRQEAERRGLEDTRVVCEYTSVLETETTCDPCRKAHGTRVFMGSKRHAKMSPPNLCEGRDRCRCLWWYIMPSERGYEEIIEELRERGPGGAQVGEFSQTDEATDIRRVAETLQQWAA